MSEPLISVVLTNHDGERFVGKAIQSGLDQTFTDFELIIVDDASTDKSLDVIRSFDDSRIRVWESPVNGHVSYAHNQGNALARGKYIAAMDNDDLWKPEKLAKQIEYMEAHPEAGVCFTSLDFIDENDRPYEDEALKQLYTIHNGSREEWLHTLLVTGNHVANDSSLIRKSVMDAVGNNDLCMLQLHDYDMYVRIAQISDLYIIEEPLMSYRRFEGSGSITSLSENARRAGFEFSRIIGRTVTEMEPELFRRVFAEEMQNPQAETEEEILCEKAILLSSDKLHEDCRLYAFELYEKLLADEKTAAVLWNKYDINQHEAYRLTGQPLLYNRTAEVEHNILQGKYDELLNRYLHLEIDHQQTVGSIYWKMTAPLRKVLRPLKARSEAKKEAKAQAEASIPKPEQSTPEETAAQREETKGDSLLFSVLLVPNEDKEAQKRTVQSLKEQSYPQWELCLAEDKKACLEKAKGDWIVFLEPGDVLSPSALYRMRKAMDDQTDLVYTDDLVLKETGEAEARNKPALNMELLRGENYIGRAAAFHCVLTRKFQDVFDPEDANNYDLILRVAEKARKTEHVPGQLFMLKETKTDPAAGIKALEAHLERAHLQGIVKEGRVPGIYRIAYEISGEPKISIIIPNKDHAEDLKKCVDSIREKTAYPAYEILVVDNGSETKAVKELYAELKKDPGIRVTEYNEKFNFSAVCNRGAAETDGEYILLLNNDTEVISPDWLEQMLTYAQRPDVGAVGAMLYYPDDTVQHGGVVPGTVAATEHYHWHRKRGEAGELNRMCLPQEMMAVTGACLLVRRNAWAKLGGLDETFAVSYNDIDFCLRAREAGLKVIWTPYAELYHHESKSRGTEQDPWKVDAFKREDRRFLKRWGSRIQGWK